jgi:hypothetical protein
MAGGVRRLEQFEVGPVYGLAGGPTRWPARASWGDLGLRRRSLTGWRLEAPFARAAPWELPAAATRRSTLDAVRLRTAHSAGFAIATIVMSKILTSSQSDQFSM